MIDNVSVILAVVTVIALVILGVMLAMQLRLLHRAKCCSVTIQGTVITLEEVTIGIYGRYGSMFKPRIRYEYGGDIFEITAAFPHRYSDYRVGEEISIRVNPDFPEEAMLPAEAARNKTALVVQIAAILFIAVIGFGNAWLIANPRQLGQLFKWLVDHR